MAVITGSATLDDALSRVSGGGPGEGRGCMQANRTSWGIAGTSSTHMITVRTLRVGVLGYVSLRARA